MCQAGRKTLSVDIESFERGWNVPAAEQHTEQETDDDEDDKHKEQSQRDHVLLPASTCTYTPSHTQSNTDARAAVAVGVRTTAQQ